jgi:RNA polymerase sigma factor (TIGR02999 family)
MSLPSPSKKQITAMLRAWGAGGEQASDELIRAVYDELRRQARFQLRRERANHTLDTSALINEAYLKLIEQRSVKWSDRNHFYALASKLMRRVLVDHARTRHRLKRGGEDHPVELDAAMTVAGSTGLDIDLLALDEAMARLAALDEQQEKIVELRYFAGLEITETAAVLGISTATVKRDWAMAKAWLKQELTRGTSDE